MLPSYSHPWRHAACLLVPRRYAHAGPDAAGGRAPRRCHRRRGRRSHCQRVVAARPDAGDRAGVAQRVDRVVSPGARDDARGEPLGGGAVRTRGSGDGAPGPSARIRRGARPRRPAQAGAGSGDEAAGPGAAGRGSGAARGLDQGRGAARVAWSSARARGRAPPAGAGPRTAFSHDGAAELQQLAGGKRAGGSVPADRRARAVGAGAARLGRRGRAGCGGRGGRRRAGNLGARGPAHPTASEPRERGRSTGGHGLALALGKQRAARDRGAAAPARRPAVGPGGEPRHGRGRGRGA